VGAVLAPTWRAGEPRGVEWSLAEGSRTATRQRLIVCDRQRTVSTVATVRCEANEPLGSGETPDQRGLRVTSETLPLLLDLEGKLGQDFAVAEVTCERCAVRWPTRKPTVLARATCTSFKRSRWVGFELPVRQGNRQGEDGSRREQRTSWQPVEWMTFGGGPALEFRCRRCGAAPRIKTAKLKKAILSRLPDPAPSDGPKLKFRVYVGPGGQLTARPGDSAGRAPCVPHRPGKGGLQGARAVSRNGL